VTFLVYISFCALFSSELSKIANRSLDSRFAISGPLKCLVYLLQFVGFQLFYTSVNGLYSSDKFRTMSLSNLDPVIQKKDRSRMFLFNSVLPVSLEPLRAKCSSTQVSPPSKEGENYHKQELFRLFHLAMT
jgi:hypothetical protein